MLTSAAWATGAKEVLHKLGDEARAQEDAAPCSYRETTTVDELGKDGQVVGTEIRVFEVEATGTEVTRRKLISVKKSGEPLADLLAQPRDTKGKKAARSPLHPLAQAQYRFELQEGPQPGQLTLSFEPVKRNFERIAGEVVVDARTLQMEELRFSPSRVPPLLKTLQMRHEYGDTACGRMPVVLEVKGEAVPILIGTKFRTRSVLEGHHRVTAPKEKPRPSASARAPGWPDESA